MKQNDKKINHFSQIAKISLEYSVLFYQIYTFSGQVTWAVAAGKPDVMLLLMNKLMEDGNVLYKVLPLFILMEYQ